MPYHALYVDDEILEAHRGGQYIRELLNKPDEFECELIEPPKLIRDVLTHDFDVLLIDLQLISLAGDGNPAGYWGTSLASEVRFGKPDLPIVLVTRAAVLAGKAQFLSDSTELDLIVDKDDIIGDPTATRRKIEILVDGYRALAASDKNWSDVVSLMQASPEEANLLREAAPPLDQGTWNVQQMSRWIRNVVLRFPGILYDQLTAATRLGVKLDDFSQPDVQELFRAAQYSGVFNSSDKRWWRSRLFEIAQNKMRQVDGDKPSRSIPEGFRSAFQAIGGHELSPAICIYDNTPTADWVCHILQQPVKQRNSIPYYPDNRPGVMDQARVSFKAIKEADEFDEDLVDAESYSLVKELWE